MFSVPPFVLTPAGACYPVVGLPPRMRPGGGGLSNFLITYSTKKWKIRMPGNEAIQFCSCSIQTRLHDYRRKWSVCWMKSRRKGDKNCVRVIAYHQLYIVHSCYHSNQVPHTLWWHWNDFECTDKNNRANITRLTSSSLPCQCAWLATSWSFI